jgi:hypothetical protein
VKYAIYKSFAEVLGRVGYPICHPIAYDKVENNVTVRITIWCPPANRFESFIRTNLMPEGNLFYDAGYTVELYFDSISDETGTDSPS